MANDLDRFIDRLAGMIADRIAGAMGGGRSKPDGRRNSKMKGRKLDMTCRFPGCKNRSKGPRFSFMCEKHMGKKGAARKGAAAKA